MPEVPRVPWEKSSAREEYFLVKLIFSWIKADYAQKAFDIADITKVSQSLWLRLFLSANNHSQYKKTLVLIFGKKLKILWLSSRVSLLYAVRMVSIETR